jgi:hypothetical protein
MRSILYFIIDDCGKLPEHHFSINSQGFVLKKRPVHEPVKILDRRDDPDEYNAGSIAICVSRAQKYYLPLQQETLVNLLVKLRRAYPEAMIFGLSEIGGSRIKVSKRMNQVRLEMSDRY